MIHQLVTDSGRTSNLVGSSRLQAQATAQNAQATRFEVLLQVNQAYFDVLHAQAVVRVAEQTVAARQLLSDQVTELGRNNLRSQLDVSFAEVNVSQAKLPSCCGRRTMCRKVSLNWVEPWGPINRRIISLPTNRCLQVLASPPPN